MTSPTPPPTSQPAAQPPQTNGFAKPIPNPFNDSIAPFDAANRTNGVASMHSQSSAVPQPHVFPHIESFSMNFEKLDGVLRNFSNSSNPFASQSQAEKATAAIANGLDMNELDLTAKRLDFTMNGSGFTPPPGHIESDTNALFGGALAESNGGKKPDNGKKEIPHDLLKDVAKAAFNEFSNGKYKNHEFVNKIASVDRVGDDIENSRVLLK